MATEKDLELLDDYLSNKLDGQEKVGFEKRLESDASLKSEYKLQKALVEGIKHTRMVELKSMLNQTVIPPASTGSAILKITLSVLLAGAATAGLYYFFQNNNEVAPETEETAIITNEAPAESPLVAEEQPEEQTTNESPVSPAAVTKEEATKKDITRKENTTRQQPETRSAESTQTANTPVKQPDLNPYDPTEELDTNQDKPQPVEGSRTTERVTTSRIKVEIEEGNKKFSFHYQFKEGKLMLYGSFEKDLYEILEFFDNNKRTVFLYYNSNYYLLDETKEKPTPLKAIADPDLLKKLREYRGN